MDPTGTSLGIAIGHLALKERLITPEQLREALAEQSRAPAPTPLDTILVSKKFLTPVQVDILHTLRETTVFPATPGATPAAEGPLVRIGRYDLIRVAGKGAMAKVYEALDPQLQRKVAIKILNPNPNAHPDEALVEEERFLREARVLAGLPKHPNIIGVYEAGVIDGRRFLAMEYVDGIPMDQWCKRGSTTLGRPVALLRDVALAAHHAHENGVIHRDLKPANILVDGEGRPHVMDFGLAKLSGQSVRSSYTEGALAVGTPAYMSPEQGAGTKDIDRRTDVYSMGVMLYELLTGRLPFSGTTPMEVMVKTSKDPVVPPSKITGIQINPDHFKTLESICLKALAKNPADRHSTAEKFAEDLSQWLRGRDFRVRSARLRKRLILGAAAVLVVSVTGAVLARTQPWRVNVEAQVLRADALLISGRPEEALALYASAEALDPEHRRARDGRKRAMEALAPKPAPPPPPPADPWKNAINLLAAVELPRDAVSGVWMMDGEVLMSREGKPARVQFPHRPPDEYDLRATVSRRPGNFCIDFILSRGGMPFTLVMQRDGIFGFERIGGQDYHKNATTARFDGALQPGKKYEVLIEVRSTGVKVACNGQALTVLKSYDGLSMNPDWKLPDPDALGVGTWDGGAAIEKLELRELPPTAKK